jgi:hypothetical protein
MKPRCSMNCTQEKVELKVEGREDDFNLSFFIEIP